MRRLSPLFSMLVALGQAAFFTGCQSVPAYQQEHLSKPAMTFSDSLVDQRNSSLTAQVEPGSQTSGGAQSTGCSACR